MNYVVSNFEKVKKIIGNNVNIIAVSKTFKYDHIKPLIEYGHRHFGENKVQEAQHKWLDIKNVLLDLKLQIIGKLQTNKARQAVDLFDYIHSVDSPKLAALLSKHESNLKKKRKYFIQINLGHEKQKSGILIDELKNFFDHCTKVLNLEIIGLITIPPNDGNEAKYFRTLMNLNKSLGLKELSMGMSVDFIEAIKHNATFVRIGSAIFGKRI